MNRFSEFRHEIDACRPGSDDLALSELAGLARAVETDRAIAAELDRSQRFDRAVIAALHDAPVPAGLADRLLTAVAQAAAPLNATAPATEEAATQLPPRERFSRRWVLAVAGLAAVVLVALSVVLNLPRPTRNIARSELPGLIDTWTNDVLPVSMKKPWNAYTKTSPIPAWCAIPASVKAAPLRYRTYQTPAGESAVVFDCTPPGSQRVLLFVVKSADKYPVAPLPFTKVPGTTGGRAVGAWQSQGVLYVLIVDEDQQRLEDFLRKPSVT